MTNPKDAEKAAVEHATGKPKTYCIPGNNPVEIPTFNKVKRRSFLAGVAWCRENEAGPLKREMGEAVKGMDINWGIASEIEKERDALKADLKRVKKELKIQMDITMQVLSNKTEIVEENERMRPIVEAAKELDRVMAEFHDDSGCWTDATQRLHDAVHALERGGEK